MYSFACSLSSNPIDLYTVMICECWQREGRTALLWASEGGHAATVRVLVELGASVEAVDKVHIHPFLMYLHISVTFVHVCIFACIDRCTCIRARALSHLIQLTSIL
jgi:hypothetical protein